MNPPDSTAGPTMAGGTPLRIGACRLRVRDLDGSIAFYRGIVGLDVISRGGGRARLGVDGVALLDLEHRPDARHEEAGSAGLFHIAFIIPTRSRLADWYLHARAHGLDISRTGDHAVNEAIYYDDPEGNGCECYADRPPESWVWLDDGTVDIPTSPVDIDKLLADASADPAAWRAPAGMRIGHINLRVGDVARSESFWCEAVGLDHTGRREVPKLGGTITFMSSGRYHHHVATNDFTSAGAGKRDPDRAGLAWFTVEADTAATLRGVRDRLAGAGAPLADVDGGFQTQDPWGTQVRFVVRDSAR